MNSSFLYLKLLFLSMNQENGIYTIQGLNVLDICQEFGSPLYVYDADKIVYQFKSLQGAFSNTNVKIKYAAKALTNISVLKLLKKHGSGVDVVSIQEVQLALGAGFLPGEIMYTPNCVDFSEIEEGVKLGLCINLDNLSALQKFGEKYGPSYPCGIRLNPHIMAGGNYKISTGHSNSKFGISIYQLPEIIDIVSKYRPLRCRLPLPRSLQPPLPRLRQPPGERARLHGRDARERPRPRLAAP